MIPLLLNAVVIAFLVISFPPLCVPFTLLYPVIFSVIDTQNQIRLLFCLKISLYLWVWYLLFLVELCYHSSSRSIPSASFPTFPTSQHIHTCTYTHASLVVADHSRLCLTTAICPASEPALDLCPLLSVPGFPAYFCVGLQEQDKPSAELFFLPGRMNIPILLAHFI